MKRAFKADFVHGSLGSFVTVQPDWSLTSPHVAGESYNHQQISSCYYMSSDDARDLAKQLIRAAVAADGPDPAKEEPASTSEAVRS